MLESLDGSLARKSLVIAERVLDGDDAISSAQQRTAVAIISSEIKLRGTRNREMTNIISFVKLHPNKDRQAAIAEAALRRLLPEVPASDDVEGPAGTPLDATASST
jgi:hypothetical protein